MNPCSKNRKSIAWLALDSLDAGQATALRDHLALCEGCRRYWEEISGVRERLASAAPDSDLVVSESFHRRVSERLQATECGSVLENLAAWLRGPMPTWRVALPAVAVLAIVLLALAASRRQPAPTSPAPLTAHAVPAISSESDMAPTIANYRMVASRSLDKLDALLTRQGGKRLQLTPVYTVSSFELADSPE